MYFNIQPFLTDDCANETADLDVCADELAIQAGCCAADCVANMKKVL
jgi:hypothetical protein